MRICRHKKSTMHKDRIIYNHAMYIKKKNFSDNHRMQKPVALRKKLSFF